MILTDKQAHQLLVILQDSLRINIVGVFGISIEDRRNLLQDILTQQCEEPKKIK